jgi:hypothetical protein
LRTLRARFFPRRQATSLLCFDEAPCGYNGATSNMKAAKITRAQYKALQLLSHKDLRLIRKHPKLVSNSKQLLVVCRKVLKKIEAIPKYAGRKKRETVYKRIAALCRKAIEKIEH